MSVDVSGGRIRQAADRDIPAVVRCLTAAFEEYRDRYTPQAFRDTVLTIQGAEQRMRAMTILVVDDYSANVVGTVAYQVMESGEGHVRGMAVDPLLHGKGIAARLLSRAEGELRKLGCSRVTLDTTQPLERAIRFYVREGYEPTGVVRDFFGMPLFEYVKTL